MKSINFINDYYDQDKDSLIIHIIPHSHSIDKYFIL